MQQFALTAVASVANDRLKGRRRHVVVRWQIQQARYWVCVEVGAELLLVGASSVADAHENASVSKLSWGVGDCFSHSRTDSTG